LESNAEAGTADHDDSSAASRAQVASKTGQAGTRLAAEREGGRDEEGAGYLLGGVLDGARRAKTRRE